MRMVWIHQLDGSAPFFIVRVTLGDSAKRGDSMIGTYGSSAIAQDGIRTAEDYFAFLFGNSAGYHTISKKYKSGRWAESFYTLDELIHTNRDGQSDWYCALNSFLSPRRKNCAVSGRKVENIKHLNALYVDIDCYTHGLLPEHVHYILQEDYYNSIIPVPSLVVSSGRGLYLIWKINEDRNALPRWKKIEQELFTRLMEFGADPQAVDAARVLRFPNTVNSKSGNSVSVLECNDVQYTLYEISQEFDIECSAAKNTYGKATYKQIKTAKMLATAFNLEYPDFEKFDETAAFIKEYLPRYNEQKQAQSPKMHNLDARRAASALADGRIRDLYRLFAMRKGGDCCREYALFLCRIWMLDLTGDPEIAKTEMLRLNASMDKPLVPNQAIKATASAQKKWESGSHYAYSTEKIVSVLALTDEEQAEMLYLRVSPESQQIRRKKSNRNAYLRKLESCGKSIKSVAVEQRRIKMRQMLADGCTMQEICLELGISERTYARDKAAIAASETVNDNAAAIQDEPAVLAVPDNQTAPTKGERRNGLKLPRRAALPKIQSIYYKKSLISALSAAQFLAWWAVLFGAV